MPMICEEILFAFPVVVFPAHTALPDQLHLTTPTHSSAEDYCDSEAWPFYFCIRPESRCCCCCSRITLKCAANVVSIALLPSCVGKDLFSRPSSSPSTMGSSRSVGRSDRVRQLTTSSSALSMGSGATVATAWGSRISCFALFLARGDEEVREAPVPLPAWLQGSRSLTGDMKIKTEHKQTRNEREMQSPGVAMPRRN